jgi:hypothetical protein
MGNSKLLVAVYAVLGVLICINLAATRCIFVNKLSELRQKIIQTVFVWVTPGVGAATVFAVIWEVEQKGGGQYPSEDSLGGDPNIGFRNSATDYFNDGHHGS